MAVKNFYPTNNLASVHQEMSETVPSATPFFLSPVTGWITGTGSTNRSPLNSQVEQLTSTFVGTTHPDGTIDTTTGDCFRSTNTYTGTFAATAWSFRLLVASNTIVDGSGRAYFRLFRGANADGSGATEITSSALQGNTVGLVVGAVNAVTSLNSSFSPGAISLTNEYLFIQVAWERTVAGGMSTADVNIVTYSSGQCLVTPDFTSGPTQQSLTGSLSFVGADALRTFKTLAAGALSFVGTFTRARLLLQTLTSTLFSSGGVFDPSTITGLKMWVKADSISASDGDQVLTWEDQSSNNYDLTGEGTGNKPTYQTGVINGKPAIRFIAAGSQSFTGSGSIGISQPNTIIVVAKQTVLATEARFMDSTTPRQLLGFGASTGFMTLYAGSGPITDSTNHSGAFHVVSSIFNGASSEVFIDSSSALTGNPGTQGLGTVFLCKDGFGNWSTADIAEVLIYNSALSGTDRGNVETYLKNKYAIAGGVTAGPQATLTLETLKVLAATLSFAAAFTRRLAKAFTATLSFAGALTKRIADAGFTAAVSFIGNLTSSKLFVRALTATLSFVGALSRRTGKALTATLSFVGNLAKSFRRALTAAVSFVGSLTKRITRTLTSALSFIGSLATELISGAEEFFQSVFGTLSFVGAQTKRTSHRLTGTLSFIGALAKRLPKAFTAAVSFIGTFAKLPKKLHAGAVSFIGTITRKTFHILSATLSFVSNLQSLLSHVGEHFLSLASNLSFIGTLNRSTRHIFSSVLSFIGNLGRRMPQRLSGALSFVGALAKRGSKRLTGALSFVGSLATTAAHLFSLVLPAALSFVGNLTRQPLFGRVLTATLNTTGVLTRRSAKILSASVALAGVLFRGMARTFGATLAFVGFLFRGGLTFFYGGQIAGSTLHIHVTGSTARIVRAGSELEIHRNLSGVRIAVTGSSLRVERTT